MGETIANLKIMAVELYNGSNPSLALGTIDTNCEWLKSGEFDILLLLEDDSIASMIAHSNDPGARKPFLTGSQVGIANGAQLSAMTGVPEPFQFTITGGRYAGLHPATSPRGGDVASQLAELQLENRNVNANPEIAPHVVLVGGTLFHNAACLILGGASAVSVSTAFCVINYSQSATSVQCGAGFNAAICYGALAAKMATDGQKVQAAAYFLELAKSHLMGKGLAQAA